MKSGCMHTNKSKLLQEALSFQLSYALKSHPSMEDFTFVTIRIIYYLFILLRNIFGMEMGTGANVSMYTRENQPLSDPTLQLAEFLGSCIELMKH